MRDNEFYGSGKHPEAGEQLVKIDGQWFSKVDIDYLKSQSKSSGCTHPSGSAPKSLNRIKSDTVNHTGFSKSRKIDPDQKSERDQQLDRLAILQNQRARLLKDLERVNSVIKSIEADLSI